MTTLFWLYRSICARILGTLPTTIVYYGTKLGKFESNRSLLPA